MAKQIEHRTSNTERPILMVLRFINFKQANRSFDQTGRFGGRRLG
jgi:hypothetical protein